MIYRLMLNREKNWNPQELTRKGGNFIIEAVFRWEGEREVVETPIEQSSVRGSPKN